MKQSDVDYITYYYLQPVLLKFFEKYARGSLLDVGCGSKPYEGSLKKYVKTHFGCDYLQSEKGNVDLVCDAINIPLEDNSFDTVICTQVLEHVFDTRKCLSECFRLLKSGGYFILSVPFIWPIHLAPYDFHRFSKFGIREYLEEAGFHDIQIYPNGGKWAMISQMVNLGIFSPVPEKRFLNFLFKCCRYLINKLSIFIDRRLFNDDYTLNYVVVCKK